MFLRIFILLVVIYYLVKWMAKLVLPHVVKHHMDNFQNQYNKQNPDYEPKKNRREGSVRVEKAPPKSHQSKDDDDYVDYEEIK